MFDWKVDVLLQFDSFGGFRLQKLMSQSIQICGDVTPYVEHQNILYSKVFLVREVAYILVKMPKSQQNAQFLINKNGTMYVCSFFKQLEAPYRSSLQNLMSELERGQSFEFKKYALSLFKVRDFIKSSFISYYIDDVKYGQEVVLVTQCEKILKVVSNCFRQEGKYYYFIDNQDHHKQEQISEIIDLNQKKILGFCVRVGKLNFCLPIKYLTFNIPAAFNINIDLEANLKKVVYLNFEGSHCTGMLISPKLVLTVRHLFKVVPEIDTAVKVRVFPYDQLKDGRVVVRSTKFVDLMVVQFINQAQIQEKKEISFELILDSFPKTKNIGIGEKVYSFGFGKFPYWDYHFQTTQMLLPTITVGVISKVIPFENGQKYFKTDLNLYNGYSGSAIWREGQWIGNTVFIVRNKISSDKHVKHNFNYSREFIQDFLNNREKIQKCDKIENFCRMFEGIHTRKQLRIRSKL